ncbi:MAG: hypothetical protein LBJ84_02310, partial [Oscillospiraceae bacterium]|nr:hypothetical protein [Oscillospiraceae bacterium]
MGIELYEHNAKAYAAAGRLLEATGRAAVVHPTGTGKSFIGHKLAEEHGGSRVLWCTPSGRIYAEQLENLEKAGCAAPGNIEAVTYAKLMKMG